MKPTVTNITKAFGLLYTSLLDRDFAKSAGFEHYRESELLHIVRAFLLGYFGRVEPGVSASLPGCPTRYGRIDFRVGNVAVELAVRSRKARAKTALCARNNLTEMKKLLQHVGPALLILFDFSRSQQSEDDLAQYRDLPSLGSGNWRTSAFNVAYFHREPRTADQMYRTMLVRTRRPIKLAA